MVELNFGEPLVFELSDEVDFIGLGLIECMEQVGSCCLGNELMGPVYLQEFVHSDPESIDSRMHSSEW